MPKAGGGAADEEDFRAEVEERLINEEYKIWKKNTPFLYDLVITHALEWPSSPCSGSPTAPSRREGPFRPEDDPRHAHLRQRAQLPHARAGPAALDDAEADARHYDDDHADIGGSAPPLARWTFFPTLPINSPLRITRSLA
ncbi:unnamed protein product [Miscanthus lutarioriparius]|uniref:Histone-binding protein RBBP4-like N-terminal domain-containing protein n=1 Tax=Miscanthus lutarioriparius TaxID=422564 RepID=A0A811N0W2_9POAL|nr:unnamed protein product [Miscanthus lutarioriparius]